MIRWSLRKKIWFFIGNQCKLYRSDNWQSPLYDIGYASKFSCTEMPEIVLFPLWDTGTNDLSSCIIVSSINLDTTQELPLFSL